MLASEMGHLQVVQALLTSGANVNQANNNGIITLAHLYMILQ